MADNKIIASDVLEAVGGSANVTSVTHCMTRLRLNLKDESLASDEKINNVNGVLSVVHAGGQIQVVIGQNVPKVYEEFCKLGGFAVKDAIQENLDGPKEKLTLKKVGGNILNYLTSCMTPMIPVMMAAGLFKSLMAILGPGLLGVLTEESHLYILLDFLYDAGFYFLPIYIGYNAAKKLNVVPILGAYMGCVLLAPDFVAMVTDGAEFTIFGIPVIMNNYSQTVLPIVVSVAALAFIYKAIAKVMPDTLSTIFTPFLTMMITIPISLLLLAPIGTIVSNLVGDALIAFSNGTGFVGVSVISGLWEFLVMTGLHSVLSMAFMMNYFEVGYFTSASLGAYCATWACFGVALGAFLRLRNKEARSMSLGFFISGILGGVTEPTLYGLCFKYRHTFIPLAIGGAVGGLYAGITHLNSYVISSTNFLSLIAFTGGTTANFVNGVISMVLSLVAAAVATYFIGFTKEELQA